MSSTKFCVTCREEVHYSIRTKKSIHEINEIEYEYNEVSAICDVCGDSLYVGEIMDQNIKALYDAFRMKNGLIFPERMIELLEKYAIEEQALSKLIDWDDHTLTRFIDGDMPTKQDSDILVRLYDDPTYFLSLLEANSSLLPMIEYEKSRKKTLEVMSKKTPEVLSS